MEFEFDSALLVASAPATDEYIKPVMKKMVEQKDGIVRLAIDAAIGSAWTLDNVARRCQWVRVVGNTFETLAIDGEPALEMHDLEVSPAELRADSYVSSVTQRYRFLGRAAHLNKAD
jgi:hypothetical protein